MRIETFILLCVCMYVCMHVYMCVYLCMCVCIYVCVCMCVCMHCVCMHVHKCVCVCERERAVCVGCFLHSPPYSSFLFILFYEHEGFPFLHVYTPHACRAYEGQKRPQDPLELKLQMVVSCPMAPGNLTWAVYKSNSRSWLLGILTSPSTSLLEAGSLTEPGAHQFR